MVAHIANKPEIQELHEAERTKFVGVVSVIGNHIVLTTPLGSMISPERAYGSVPARHIRSLSSYSSTSILTKHMENSARDEAGSETISITLTTH